MSLPACGKECNAFWQRNWASDMIHHRFRRRLVAAADIGLSLGQRICRYPLADRSRSLSCTPLLMVSPGRTGTTLLRSMLVASRQIAIPPESFRIPPATYKFLAYQAAGWRRASRRIVRLFDSHPRFHIWETDLTDVYAEVVQLATADRSLARIIDLVFCAYRDQHLQEAGMWGDQTPLNALYLPWVYRTFPDAKYLHVVRDGRDTIASLIEMGTSLATATNRWIVAVSAAAELSKRMKPGQFAEIRYERLVSSPEEALEQVSQFVGIQYTPAMLEFWKSSTTIEHRYYEHHQKLTKPVSTESVGRWTTRLSAEQQQFINSTAGPWLSQYGYSES